MTTRLGFLAVLAALGGCASVPGDRVVLLPSADGTPAQISVRHGDAETVLSQPYGQVSVDSRGRAAQTVREASEVRAEFRNALDALPPRPVSHMLYFLGDSDELTPESKRLAQTILGDIAQRPAAEVVLIGHTDRMGTVEYNDALSLARARVVEAALVALGMDRSRIVVAGRGEREPLVVTPDETPEPRNRRVEINVR